MSELVEQLRFIAVNKAGTTIGQVTEETVEWRAADTIEALQAENAELRELLSELADLMDATVNSEYIPDSFTTQAARIALTQQEDKGDE